MWLSPAFPTCHGCRFVASGRAVELAGNPGRNGSAYTSSLHPLVIEPAAQALLFKQLRRLLEL